IQILIRLWYRVESLRDRSMQKGLVQEVEVCWETSGESAHPYPGRLTRRLRGPQPKAAPRHVAARETRASPAQYPPVVVAVFFAGIGRTSGPPQKVELLGP